MSGTIKVDRSSRTRPMSAKQDLLNEAARQYRAFHETIQGLNEEHMAEAWLGR